MRIKKIASNVWKYSKRAYLAAFIAVNLHIGYDFAKNHISEKDDKPSICNLAFHRYKTVIDGKEKQFTVAGETHFYNETESKLAKMLVSQHDIFANECGDKPIINMPLKDSLFGLALATSLTPGMLYDTLGSQRYYDGIDEFSQRKIKGILPLEEDSFSHLSNSEKVKLLIESIISIPLAPLQYYSAKNETPFSEEKYKDFEYRDPLVTKRDSDMADGIVKLLRKPEVNNLLASVGRAHLAGVIKNLNQRISMQEVDEAGSYLLIK
jgi:hypothetical protein